jgi:hypothetical protein
MRHLAFCLSVVSTVVCLGGIGRADELSAGVATVDITAPVGYRMSGYFSERASTGSHDPLLAKALYLKQGEAEAVIVTCDLIGISREVSQKARAAAQEKTGVPAANMIIAATHSHTGPLYFGALREHFHFQAMIAKGKDEAEKVDYSAELIKKLAETIAKAKAAAQPVSLYAGYAEQQGLSFNRRFHMKDGSVVFNPGKLNANIVRVAGPIDPEVGLVALKDATTAKPVAAMTTFALHLDTVGGTEYAADYPLYLSQALQKKYGDTFTSLFAAGTCGDINHIDVSHDRPQKGHEEANRIGDALAETVLAKLPELVAVKEPTLAVRRSVVNAPLQKFTEAEVVQARKDLHKIGGRDLPFLGQVKAYKIVAVSSLDGPTLPMEVQAIRLGDDVALVGLPGEVFVDLGLAIKTASPFATTIVMELCNDAPGYVPTKKAFAEGSYETVNSRVQAGGGELLVEAATRLLKELHKKDGPDTQGRSIRPPRNPVAAQANRVQPAVSAAELELAALRHRDRQSANDVELRGAMKTLANGEVELEALRGQLAAATNDETRRRLDSLIKSHEETVQLARELVDVLAARHEQLQQQRKDLENQSLRRRLEEVRTPVPVSE